MRLSASIWCGLALLSSFVHGDSIAGVFEANTITRRDLNSSQVQRELGPKLSKSSSIYGPDDTRFKNATARWDVFAAPKIQLVVEPGVEADVPTIVKYCNDNSIEFLAVNKAHGSTATLGRFNGIQISLSNLRNITIQSSGKSAWFGGGVYDGQALSYLWNRGYVTTVASCDCIGILGPGLGGGHGRLEGLYGMISDNFLTLNVVLANATAIRVSSASNPDLFWAMKGAGHNFGIVTSFEMNIFPRGPPTWHYANYLWRGAQLEKIFTALNALQGNGTSPVNMAATFGTFFVNASVSTSEPLIHWTFAYRGTASEAAPYLSPFDAIPSISRETGDVPLPSISAVQDNDANSSVCQDGNVRITTTAGLQVYNLTAERKIFDAFTSRLRSSPELAATGSILHEGYSTEAVTSKNPDDSAYPFRADHHLMQFSSVFPPEKQGTLEKGAWEWAIEVRRMWNEGQPGRLPDAYVNYANGFETVEEWYGHEAWRIERLRGLKGRWDPGNRFGYYNPIVKSGARARDVVV